MIETFILLGGLIFSGFAILLDSRSRKTQLLHDMIVHERTLSIKLFNFQHEVKFKNYDVGEEEVSFLIINHLNFYEHLALWIQHWKIKEKTAKKHFKKLLINTVETYKNQDAKYLEGLPHLNSLYEKWKNENRKWLNLSEINWKKVGIEAVVGFLFTLIALSLFTFVINPAITDKPNVELITIDPLIINGGENVNFNFTLENTGEATAENLLVWAYEEELYGEEQQSDVATISKRIMQEDDLCSALLELKAPDNQQSKWVVELFITTTNGYGWEYHVIYNYDITTNQYLYHNTNMF